MKRNTIRALGGVLLSLALVAATTACEEATPEGKDKGKCSGKIAFMGALSGGNASIVIPSFNGAKLAFEQFLAKNPDCKITLQEFDTEGDPAKASPVANKIVADKEFIGVIGGAFSGETRQTKATFDAGGVTMISQSATATDLTLDAPAKVFHRVVGHDESQGAAIATYLVKTVQAKQAFVVNDGTAYGAPLAKKIVETAGSAVKAEDTVQEKQTDFAATISKIKGAKADAVVYAGYANEAGPFLKQLRGAGLKIPFIGGDGLYGADFPKAAGAQAEGAVVTCPCLPAEKAKDNGQFAKDYEAKFKEAPGAYGAEGFDAAMIFLQAIEAGNTSRDKVEAFVDSYDQDGITKHIKFDDKGDVDKAEVVIWTYKIEGGKLVPGEEVKLSS